jgi:hypothetical protein
MVALRFSPEGAAFPQLTPVVQRFHPTVHRGVPGLCLVILETLDYAA